jgi:hypothetical protein
MLVNEIESEERMAQMVEHAHKQDEVEALAQCGYVVDGKASEIDLLIEPRRFISSA